MGVGGGESGIEPNRGVGLRPNLQCLNKADHNIWSCNKAERPLLPMLEFLPTKNRHVVLKPTKDLTHPDYAII